LNAKEVAGDFPEWPKLKTLRMAMSYRKAKGKEPSL